MHRSPKAFGELGELAFLLQAVRMGLRVMVPFGQAYPYDSIVDNGWNRWRMQVKATETTHSKSSYRARAARTVRGKGGKFRSIPYSRLEIDFVVFYVEPIDSFFIIPIEALHGRTSLSFSLSHPNRGFCAPYRNRWGLLTDPRLGLRVKNEGGLNHEADETICGLA